MLPTPRTRLLPALTVLLSLIGLACGGGDAVVENGEQVASLPSSAEHLRELPVGEAEMAAYNSSSFNICDVKVLGAYWGSLEYDTKSTISSKILAGGEPLVGRALDEARGKALSSGTPTCSIEEMGYTPDDAAVIAAAWNSDLTEAKAAMFNKYLNVGKEGLADELQRLRAEGYMSAAEAGEDDMGEPPDRAMDAFWAGSDLCEARMVAHYWGDGVFETKTLIGQKLLAGMGDLVQQQVNGGYFKDGAPECSWSDLNYRYEDAEALSKYWNSDVSETKTRMTHKIRSGNRDYLNEELGRARAM